MKKQVAITKEVEEKFVGSGEENAEEEEKEDMHIEDHESDGSIKKDGSIVNYFCTSSNIIREMWMVRDTHYFVQKHLFNVFIAPFTKCELCWFVEMHVRYSYYQYLS